MKRDSVLCGIEQCKNKSSLKDINLEQFKENEDTRRPQHNFETGLKCQNSTVASGHYK